MYNNYRDEYYIIKEFSEKVCVLYFNAQFEMLECYDALGMCVVVYT